MERGELLLSCCVLGEWGLVRHSHSWSLGVVWQEIRWTGGERERERQRERETKRETHRESWPPQRSPTSQPWPQPSNPPAPLPTAPLGSGDGESPGNMTARTANRSPNAPDQSRSNRSNPVLKPRISSAGPAYPSMSVCVCMSVCVYECLCPVCMCVWLEACTVIGSKGCKNREQGESGPHSRPL